METTTTPSSLGLSPHPLDRLHRVLVFMDILSDCLDLAGRDFSKHLGSYSLLCDLMSEEVEEVIRCYKTDT